jgi:hypothetical protein
LHGNIQRSEEAECATPKEDARNNITNIDKKGFLILPVFNKNL